LFFFKKKKKKNTTNYKYYFLKIYYDGNLFIKNLEIFIFNVRPT